MTGYKGNGKTVIVMLNMNSISDAQPIILESTSVASLTPYVTSSVENCVQESNVPVSNGAFTGRLAPLSITTFVSQ